MRQALAQSQPHASHDLIIVCCIPAAAQLAALDACPCASACHRLPTVKLHFSLQCTVSACSQSQAEALASLRARLEAEAAEMAAALRVRPWRRCGRHSHISRPLSAFHHSSKSVGANRRNARSHFCFVLQRCFHMRENPSKLSRMPLRPASSLQHFPTSHAREQRLSHLRTSAAVPRPLSPPPPFPTIGCPRAREGGCP